MGLSLENVDKVVGREIHLKEVNVELASGSRNVILGRTLGGKTSLLRIMAGLDRPTRGRLVINDKDMTGVSVRKRSVAMVYQQFINYPSLTVYENIASPLKIAGEQKKIIEKRVNETAGRLHIEELLDRLPGELSGGQQQRTAIARALVKETDLLLLDEPLVNLDYKLREELRLDLQEIFKQRQAIVVYTTTEPVEALMLGGNLIVVDEGRILQSGPTSAVYHHPVDLRVADIFSDPPINYLTGSIDTRVARLSGGLEFILPRHMQDLPAGEYTFAIRSNHISLAQNHEQDARLKAKVELAEITGSESFIHVEFANSNLVVQEDGVHPHRMGASIDLYLHPGMFFVYDRAGALAASPSGEKA